MKTPPLVLLHAFPFSSALYYPQRIALEALGITVIAPDQRGLATNEKDPGAYALDDVADDVARLLDSRGIDKAVVGGLSMGGYVALRFVARHGARLAGLVLSDTKAGADSEEGKKNRATLAARVRGEGPSVAFDPVKLLGPKSNAERPELVGFARGLAESRPRWGVARALEAMAARPDSSADLAKVSVPVLVIVGQDDVLTPPAESEKMAKTAPSAKLRKLEGAGHLANLEAPEAWNRAVLSFLLDL